MSDDFTTTPNYGLFKPTPNADYDLWGDHLNANADKLDTVIRGIAAAGNVSVNQIDADAFGVQADFQELAGPVSWTGTTVTIAGANFTAADVGKTLIMPFGGDAGGVDAPALVTITSVIFGTVCTVDTSATHPLTGAAWQFSGSNIPTINSFGTGGAVVGELLTVQGGVLGTDLSRPATYYTSQIRARSVTAVANGHGGPPNATVYLSGTTGHGRRPTFAGTTDANGVLIPGSLTIIEAGVLTHNPTNPTNEPLAGDQQDIKLPGSWAASGTQVTISSAVSAGVLPVLRVGMELTGAGDNNAQGIKFGSVITAISGAVVTFTPAAVNAGTNQDVRFILNSQRFVFSASFANNSSTITASAPLPSWVQPGALISGYGIVGGADPKAAANTTITAIAGTTITISQNTTHAATGGTSITINPFLAGVAANISFEPIGLHLKDAGVYKTPLTFPASVRGAVDKGVTITPPTSVPLAVGFGTDNAVALEGWASALRSAVATQAALGTGVGAGIEAILRPGNYLSSAFLNFVGMAWPGLFIKLNGATIHSVAAGKVAIDFRASRYVVIDQPTIMGDQYFPPKVGMAIGQYDPRQGNNLQIRSATFWGYYGFAGLDAKNCETTTIDGIHVQNLYTPDPPPAPAGRVPPLLSPPVFGICIDGYQHWPVACEVAPVGSVLAQDVPLSFNGLCLSRASSMVGSGIPWTINGANGLRVANGYAQTTVGPGILYFGDGDIDADLEIHCESHAGQSGAFSAANTAGIQDAIMVAAISNPIMQFDSRYVDYASQAANAILAYDVERYYGLTSSGDATPGGLITSHRAELDVKGFGGTTAQIFDYMHDVMYQQSAFGGTITAGGVLYTALTHLMNTPSVMTGVISLGDTEQDFNYRGFVQGDNMFSRGSVTANTDVIAAGWVYAQTGLSIGQLGILPRATLTFDGTQINSNVPINLPAGSTGAFLPLSGGTVTGQMLVHQDTVFTPAGGNQGSLIVYGNMSGTMGSVGGVAPFEILIGANSVDSTGNPGSSFFSAQIQHNFGGTKGGQGSLRIVQNQIADVADTAGFFTNPLAVELALAHSGLGFGNGIAASAAVTVSGPGWGLIEAEELGVALNAGAVVGQAYVQTQIWNASAHATGGDAFSCYVTGAGNSVAPRSVWQIGRTDSQWPVDPAGWLMTTTQQTNNNPGSTQRRPQACAGGLDFWKVNFSSAALRTSGVAIGSGAVVQVGTALLAEDSNGLTIDATGSVGTIASVSAGGAGYQVNDQLYDGLGGIIRVSAVGGGGAITAAAYIAGKEPYYFGTGPATVSTTGGSGNSAAVFNVTWTARSQVTFAPAGGNVVSHGPFYAATGITSFNGSIINGTAAGTSSSLALVGASASTRTLNVYTAGTSAANLRWTVGTGVVAEGGGNTGSDFYITAYSDTGVSLFNPFSIARATGVVTLGAGAIVIGGALAATGAGINTGSSVVAVPTDFTKHLCLHTAAGYGITVTSGQLNVIVGNVASGYFTSAGASLGTVGFNHNAPIAKPTGWGSSTGGARAAITASSTLPQVAAGLAQLLNDLTAYGLIGV